MYKLIIIKKDYEGKTITISKNLLKLFKIACMYQNERGYLNGYLYILDENDDMCSVDDLDIEDYRAFRTFEDKIKKGAWFKSYNYLNRF